MAILTNWKNIIIAILNNCTKYAKIKQLWQFFGKNKNMTILKNGKNIKLMILGKFFEFVDFQKYKQQILGYNFNKVFEYLVK